jgi:integrase
MVQNVSVCFYPKKRQGESDLVFVYLRITVRKEGCEKPDKVELSTGKKVDIRKWSAAANRLVGKSDDVKSANDYFNVLEVKVNNAHNHLMRMEQEVTAEKIKLLVEGKPLEPIRTILPVFKEHNDRMKSLIGKDYAYGTWERYETSYDHTAAFMKEVYKADDFDIKKFDLEFIQKYEFWLKTVRNCNHNSTMKYLANFKKIVLICVKRKWIMQDPFGEFKMTKKKVKKTPLTQHQIDELALKHFSSERLTVVRDIFLFCCYTGLPYAEIEKLKRSDIFTGIDGYRWIDNERVKTDGAARIPLLPVAEQLMDKYANDPDCLEKGLAFPVRSNQKMNEYLKEIADLCEININLTFHIARHTFATTICLTNGISMETTSKLLCHASMVMTAGVYAQIVDRKVSQEMMTIRDKYRSLPCNIPKPSSSPLHSPA